MKPIWIDTWRVNLHLSNTEPLLRLNVETKGGATALDSRTRTIEKLITTNSEEPPPPFTQCEEGQGK